MRNSMTVAKAADALDVSRPTIRRWLKEGLLRGRRVGKRKLWIDADSVEEMAEGEDVA